MKHDYNKIVYLDKKRKDALWIDWTLGNHCNFSCSYCPDILHDGSEPWPSLQECKKFVHDMILHYKKLNKKYFIFNLLGGEPTVWKNLEKFCILVKEIAAENNVTAIIEILTNGGRTMRWWHDNYHLLDVFKITHHSEFADPHHTKELAEYIYKKNLPVWIQVPMLPNIWDTCVEHLKIISNSDCHYSVFVKTLLIDFDIEPYPYTSDQKDFMSQFVRKKKGSVVRDDISISSQTMLNDIFIEKVKPSQILIDRKHSWSGWKCWAGIDLISINRRGYTKLGGGCLVKYPNFTQKHISDNFEFPTSPVTCTQKWCSCAIDIHIKKEKIND